MIKPILEKAKKDKDIIAVALFGSATRGKFYRDLDVCLFLNKKLSNISMSRKRFDFLKHTNTKIDLQVFQQLPLYIRIRVLKEGKILLCKNEDMLYQIAFQTIKDFDYFKKVYYMCLKKVEDG